MFNGGIPSGYRHRSSTSGFTTTFAITAVIIIALNLGLVWLIASGVTSGVKAVSNHCGQRYGIESIVGGDWFCPTKQESNGTGQPNGNDS